jgi:ADP-ribose pyrophosphatase YjhB (NUDIX family)
VRLKIRVGEVAGILDRVVRDAEGRIRYHWVLVDYVAFLESGTLCAASDADEAQWVEVDDVERLDTTDGLMDMIRRAVAVAEGRVR